MPLNNRGTNSSRRRFTRRERRMSPQPDLTRSIINAIDELRAVEQAQTDVLTAIAVKLDKLIELTKGKDK